MKTRLLSFVLLFIASASMLSAQAERNLLDNKAKQLTDEQLISSNFEPYAKYTDRAFWDSIIPVDYKKDIIRQAEKSAKYTYGTVPLTTYLAVKRNGNRMINEDHYKARRDNLRNLILGELAEGKGRFIDPIIDATWSLCEQTSWAISAHLNLQKQGVGVPDHSEPIIDLTVGEIGNLMGWSYYFFKDQFDAVNPLIAERIQDEVNRRIITPYLERTDLWWMGYIPGHLVNNWNPWCNFNVLTATMLTSDNEDTKARVMRKTLNSTDKFINYYKADGGCEEGPTYWDHAAGKLLEYLELVNRISNGNINIFNEPVVKRMGEYIALSHVGNGYYMNFADASAFAKGLSDIIYRYGNSTENKDLKQFAAYVMHSTDQSKKYVASTLDMTLQKMLIWHQLQNTPAIAYYPGHFFLEGTEVAGVRSKKGSTEGFFLAAKGGYNNESHNHNDVGTFSLYFNTDPILIDAGVGTYTAKTFSKDRYKIWTMQSGYHNLPMINGVQQAFGSDYKAQNMQFSNKGSIAQVSLNIANAYPAESACKYWNRSYKLDRKKGLEITDDFLLNEAKSANRVVFMVAKGVEKIEDGKLRLKGKKEALIFHYNKNQFNFEVEEVKLDDPRLSNVWGDKIYRLILTSKNNNTKDFYKFNITKN